MNLEDLGRETTLAHLQERYGHHRDWKWLAETTIHNDEAQTPVRCWLIDGGISVQESLQTGEGPWVIVVDGDLETTGDLIFRTGTYLTSTILVLGHVRARHVFYRNSA